MTNDIYTYIFDNFNIKVTDYTFKRDYILNSLKKLNNGYEKPYKEDLEYLYITCNLRRNDIIKLFNISLLPLAKWIKLYDLRKDKELVKQNIDKSLKLKYKDGENPTLFGSSGFVKNMIKKYGVENYTQTNEYIIKSKQTKLERYGNENYNNFDKSKQTKLERYGDENYNNPQKLKETCLEKYGETSYTKTEDYIIKSKQTKLERYGDEKYINVEKIKETIMNRYGVSCFTQTEKFRNRYMNPNYIEMVSSKIHNTKKKNNSYGKSNDEEIIYKKLKEVFDDVKRQYKSELYPFPCDFYIPELDLYIEYNGHWTHGKEQYVGTNEQIEKVKLWECKNTEQYKRAIDTWTKRDVLKRNMAKDNGLNYLEFFNMNEFNEWFENFGKDIIEHSKNNIDNTMYNCLK